MIGFREAIDTVLQNKTDFGTVQVPLHKAHGRILAQDVRADRDFPPFDRATRDGIAIQLKNDAPLPSYTVQGIAAAGAPQMELLEPSHCLEIMTGAILPKHATTVVMYEDVELKNGLAHLKAPVTPGQHVHTKGSDEPQGSILVKEGQRLSASEIGILAAVGQSEVLVKRNPKVGLFSTGDELVPIEATPQLHQIRQSNSHTLKAILGGEGIGAEILHVKDDKESIYTALKQALAAYDVLLISGGVSKGKYDFLPEVLEELGVQKQFHRVKQRPGKPFWFGAHSGTSTTIFGFPGNPTSTFTNYHLYFVPWLNHCFGITHEVVKTFLAEDFENTTDLTLFVLVHAVVENGKFMAKLVHGNGSGDLTSLSRANGLIKVDPKEKLNTNERVVFVPTRKII